MGNGELSPWSQNNLNVKLNIKFHVVPSLRRRYDMPRLPRHTHFMLCKETALLLIIGIKFAATEMLIHQPNYVANATSLRMISDTDPSGCTY